MYPPTHGSVDVQYSLMGIYDHLSTQGKGSYLLTYPRSYIPTLTQPRAPPTGQNHTPGPVDPYPFGGEGGTGRAGSYIPENNDMCIMYVYIYIYTHILLYI